MDFLNALVALLNYVIIPATTYGSQLAFGALGVTIIYGTLRFSNYAGGETMAWGAMFTILFTWFFQGIGISIQPLPTALLALPFSIFHFNKLKKSLLANKLPAEDEPEDML